MRKNKKAISLFISIVLVLCTLSSTVSSYATSIPDDDMIELGKTYTGGINLDYDYGCSGSNQKCITPCFYIPVDGYVIVKVSSKNRYYLSSGDMGLYDTTNDIIFASSMFDIEFNNNIEYDFNNKLYKGSDKFYVKKGLYSILFRYAVFDINNGSTYNFRLDFKPNVNAPYNFRVTSRTTTSLKVAWNKASNVNGYQLQRKVSGSYKDVKTTSRSYTFKNLKSTTKYDFRVRSYKMLDGKKYYSSWVYLSTPTKPSKVSIKMPSTNSKHQIIVKWNTVARASGYQVQYCKNSSCSSVIATKTISGQSKRSYTGKNFTKGRKYYVRVRAYKTVNGKKFFGDWSKVKSIKCK